MLKPLGAVKSLGVKVHVTVMESELGQKLLLAARRL